MTTNYISIEHAYDDTYERKVTKPDETGTWRPTGETKTIVEHNIDAWYAVREPESYTWEDGEDEKRNSVSFPGWRISGSWEVTVSSVHDIEGLRKLLDALEAEIAKEATSA